MLWSAPESRLLSSAGLKLIGKVVSWVHSVRAAGSCCLYQGTEVVL